MKDTAFARDFIIHTPPLFVRKHEVKTVPHSTHTRAPHTQEDRKVSNIILRVCVRVSVHACVCAVKKKKNTEHPEAPG